MPAYNSLPKETVNDLGFLQISQSMVAVLEDIWVVLGISGCFSLLYTWTGEKSKITGMSGDNVFSVSLP